MTVWGVRPAFDSEDKKYYQVLPYSLSGTIKCHFKFYRGVFSLIPFLVNCRVTETSAHKLANRLTEKLDRA